MKHKSLKIALPLACAACLCIGLAGCKGQEERPYDYLVTFDYNVGQLSDTEITNMYLGVNEGSRILLVPGSGNSSFTAAEFTDYYNEGWYFAKELDEEGNPVKGEDDRVLIGEKIDFATYRVQSDVALYANLLVKPTLTISGGEKEITFSGTPGDTRNEPTLSSLIPSKEGYSFAGYYEDEQFKTPFAWPYTFTQTDKTVYAKFVEGDWTVVRTEQEFLAAFTKGKPIYLDADLDFTNVAWERSSLSAELNGNGRTIRGITQSWTGTRQSGQNRFALFGTLGAGAYIHDLTIENVQATFTATLGLNNNASYEVALFALNIQEGAKLENLTVTGTLTSRAASTVSVNLHEVYVNKHESVDLGKCDFEHITVVQ